ncbi:HAMP domain-containing sensor histidine kinase [Curtobacterium sp. MCLR17_032]|uniref:sensor histidine kinase n=1 Tax=Curtobacterium sp. MCLR17_032 TaxID=2175650 RepID=UPI000DA8C29D|nr:HAMP domain-containing sensor histidine kinase [Curtobacterium sp. MCLR17_032]WIE62557.1 HAMP domain-containing sensor histidine kinase [Curtobacterium sp. MCLR17_032]
MSVRLRLTLSYAGVVLVTGALLLSVVWLFLLRYVPTEQISLQNGSVPNRHDLVRAFVPPTVGALVVLLAAGLGGGWLLAGRVLAPLRRLQAATGLVGRGSFSYRVRLPGRDDEFRQLADSFDAMLDQLAEHVAQQERFAANASHELRTPLAITRTMLEVARDDPEHDQAALVRRLLVVNERAVDLTEALLLLSRAGQRPAALVPVDLSLAAEEATETLLPLAEAGGIRLDVGGAPVVVPGVPALLLQLVVNLVHNAVVHNDHDPRSEDRFVRVSTSEVVEAAGAHACLVVENTGPQLSPELVAVLTEPFQRGVTRIHQDAAGVGLGLAIVEAVVRAHEGVLHLRPRAGGGLVVTVTLPRAAD